jgi:hypothetical protein
MIMFVFGTFVGAAAMFIVMVVVAAFDSYKK